MDLMGDVVVSLPSSSSSSSSSLSFNTSAASSASVNSSCCSSNDDSLWEEIDLAERYLVSSQFDEAATLVSSVLQKLVSGKDPRGPLHGSLLKIDGGTELYEEVSSEVDDMIESGGMVLIQAYSETGRSSKIFEVLEPIFGCVAEVPPSILLAGVCLQMSAGFFSVSCSVLDNFLQDWSSTLVGKRSCLVKSARKQNHGVVYLTWEKYTEIAEIYAVQVLAKGLRSPKLALQWVRKADILGDRRQDIIEKLENLSLLHDTGADTSLMSQYKVTKGKTTALSCNSLGRVLVSEAGEHQNKEDGMKEETPEEINSQILSRRVHLFSPVVVFLSKLITSSSFGFSQHGSRQQKLLAGWSHRKPVVGGVATFILLCVIYKQRHNLRRFVRDLLHAIHVGLVDLWQLAFNVQLNPLAAVQPLPSSRYVSR